MIPLRIIPRRTRTIRCFSTLKQISNTSVINDIKLTSTRMEINDIEIDNIIKFEKLREKESILLSPTSNYTSQCVLDTLQTVLQNKYSEGYPHARYYGGNENVDDAEELTQKRALQLFNLDENKWKVNVQPLGGYNAIFQVLTALISPFSKIMSPKNNKISQTGSGIDKYFNILKYDENTLSDLVNNFLPNLIISGNGIDSSFNNYNDYQLINKISNDINCYHLCDISDIAGPIAANLVQSPFEFCDVVVCSPFATLRGPRGAAMIFYRSGHKYIFFFSVCNIYIYI